MSNTHVSTTARTMSTFRTTTRPCLTRAQTLSLPNNQHTENHFPTVVALKRNLRAPLSRHVEQAFRRPSTRPLDSCAPGISRRVALTKRSRQTYRKDKTYNFHTSFNVHFLRSTPILFSPVVPFCSPDDIYLRRSFLHRWPI